MRRLLWALVASLVAAPASASGPFSRIEDPAVIKRLPPTPVRARNVRPFTFDARQFAEVARGVTAEKPDQALTPAALLELPHPDGGLVRFLVIESPIMAPKLAARLPEIRTYRGEGVDDPTSSVRFDVSPRGFSAMVLSAFGAWYVEPWAPGTPGVVASFHRRDAFRDPADPFRCEGPVADPHDGERAFLSLRTEPGPVSMPHLSVGPTLRTYRLALATTGEYSEKVCSPDPAATGCAAAAVVTAMNRVNGIYERELAIRMTLVANNDSVIYTNPATDPYTNGNLSALLTQNQSNLDAVIGSANYDVGHVFSLGGGGRAGLGVVCRSGLKAQAATGLLDPFGDPFYVDYVSHEMGHQFGANHTFNGSEGACTATARHAPSAFEPGSGSTIMAYAGICGSQDLQTYSDPYFHGRSFDQIVTYTTSGQGAACASASTTSNSAPVLDAGLSYTIPARTPFALTGAATDPDGDPLTYGWEQFDLGPADTGSTLVDDGARPIFRSFSATTSPTRTFPRLEDVLSGATTFGETLPTTSRTMTFRLTARDNRAGGGGVSLDTTTVTSVSGPAPFSVTAPASSVTWAGNTDQIVTWDVAGTDSAPVSCASVAIAFSSDGGSTFPTTVLASTPNDGAQAIIVPNVPTTAARIRVSCVGNVFFAISRPSFTVTAASGPAVSAIHPAFGPTAGGTPVTITGTGFAPGATVAIGGVAATSVVVNSSTSISAVTGPRAAGPVDVVVTNPGGGSATLPSGFAYLGASAGSASIAYDLTNTAGCQIVTATSRADANVTNIVTFTAPLSGSVLVSYQTYLNIGSSLASARRTGVFHSCDITDTATQITTGCPNDRFNLAYQASRGGTGTETAHWHGNSQGGLTYWWPGVSLAVPATTNITGLTPGNIYEIRLGVYRQLVSVGTSTFASATACVSSTLLRF